MDQKEIFLNVFGFLQLNFLSVRFFLYRFLKFLNAMFKKNNLISISGVLIKKNFEKNFSYKFLNNFFAPLFEEFKILLLGVIFLFRWFSKYNQFEIK